MAEPRSRTGVYSLLTFLVVVLALAGHGIFDSSYFNGAFPIVIEAAQSIGSAIFGRTPKDTSVFEYAEDGLPLCSGCHCTPGWDEDPSKFVCPSGRVPRWNYSLDVIETLASHVVQNPFELHCNPYHDEDCDTFPSLSERGKETVCGLVYDEPQNLNTRDGCPLSNYTMQTFDSESEAQSARAVVTHTGPCGACSTTQDLAAYMRHPDMVAEGRRCTNRVLLKHEWGVQCYQNLGFSKACATIWAHNSLNTATLCRSICVRHLFSPANSAEPQCRLNECLHCDEIKSGPLFQRFAGRTRRNSGLRTPILRQCEGLANMEHEACPIDFIMSAANK